jgi:hypothetical protein
MSRSRRVTAEAVREMLVGLADALRTAQETLSDSGRGGDASGPAYAIPSLDFSFHVEFSSREETPGGAPLLMLRPRPGGTHTTTEVSSRISGRLVSVPRHGGRPAPLLELRAMDDEAGRSVEVALANTAGEVLAGAQVALEVDADMTERLTGKLPSADLRLGLLSAQIVRTDAGGHAHVAVDASRLATGERVVLRAEAEGVSARIVIAGEAE